MSSPRLELRGADARLGDLPAHDYQVSPRTPLAEVAEQFKARHNLPGVLVLDEDRLVGVLSREKYLEWMSHPFGPSLFLANPIIKVLQASERDHLELDAELGINEAAEQCLNRPSRLVYDPLVVRHADGQRCLLDIHVLLLAQSKMLKLLVESIGHEKRVAEAANSAKSAFLASMSHEIRSPLNGIIAVAELLADTEMTSLQREYLSLVQTSGESLLTIINDILDFSKVEVGKLELHLEEFNLLECLGNVLKSLAVRAHAKGLELTCRIPPAVPASVVGDAGRLRQILVNLAGNAVKFTQRGEVALEVELLESNEEWIELRFSVSDTGIGVPEEKRELIFHAFEQADNSTSRRFGGTGLGLAISRNLVQLMDGRIWLESQVDQGSTFHFTIRVQRVACPRRERFPAAGADVRNSRVLLVDQHAGSRRALAEWLEHWGCDVALAASVEEGWAHIRSAADSDRPFQVLILDHHSAGARASAVCGQLLQHAAPAAAAIVLVSSASGQLPNEYDGVVRYLMKPALPADLLDALEAGLNHQPPGVASVHPMRPTVATACGPQRILLVEDSLVNQKVAWGLLGKWGHVLTLAGNGHEALAVLETQGPAAFDLVLMDVQMPGMDGVTATRHIRQRWPDARHTMPIVALTAHAMKGDRERFLEAGMDEYLSKPLRAAELAAVIDRFCGGADAAGSSSAAAFAAESTGGDFTDAETSLAAGGSDEDSRGEPCVDWQVALQTTGHDRELLRGLVEAFLEECPGRIGELQQALRDGDLKTAGRCAHTLKSAARYLGAERPRELAESLEALLERQHESEAQSVVHDLALAFAQMTRELERLARDPDYLLPLAAQSTAP